MIGREREYAVLEAALLRPDAEGTCAAVVGASGIGKTTLLSAAIDRMRATHLVRRVAGRELQQLVPYAALTELDDLEIADGAGGDPFAQVLRVTTRLVDHLTGAGPVLLCVDDLHWVDDVTVTVLDRLIDRLPDADARLIVGSRPTDRVAVRRLLARVAEVGVTVELAPLDDGAADELVASKLGRRPGAVLRELVRGAAGNPFLIAELVDALVADDALTEHGDAELRDARIPRTVRVVIARQVDQLLPDVRRTLEIAAALGDGIRIDTLAGVLEINPVRLSDQLTAAEGAGLIRRVDGRVEFRHDIIRRSLADDTDPAFARAIHLTAASVETETVTAAAHLTAAGPPFDERQILVLERAADELIDRDAERASELLALVVDQADGPTARPALRQRYIRSLLRAGRLGDVTDRLGGERPGPDEITLAVGLLDAQATQDQPDPDLVASVLDALPTLDAGTRPTVEARLSYYAVRSDAGRFREWLLDRPPPDPSWPADAQAYSRIAHAGIAALDADLERAATLAREAHRLAQEAGASPATVVRVGLNVGVFGGDLADFRDEAIDVVNEATRLAERHGLVGLLPVAHAVLANAHWAAGNWDEADAGYRSAESAARDAGVPRWVAEAHTGLCHMWADRGDAARAAAHLEACSAAGEEYRQWVGRRGWSPGGTGRGWVSHDALRARIAFGQGDDADAIRLWSTDLTDPGAPRFAKAVSAMDLVVSALAIGDDSSVALAAETLSPYPDDGLPMSLVQPLVLAAGARDLERAIEAQREAAVGPVYAVAKAAEIVGLLARELDRADVAVDCLQEARLVWERCGADALAGRDAEWLGELGVRVGRPAGARPVTGWASLTEAEARVAALVATGALYREVADRLHVSRRTVETHVANAMRKVQVRNRGELTASYWRHHTADV